MVDSFEKIPVKIYPGSKDGSKYVAQEIAALIREKQQRGEQCILGLATGSTPISMYAELVRLHREEGLSFSNVISFNLDEYYPIEKRHSRATGVLCIVTCLIMWILIQKYPYPKWTMVKRRNQKHCAAYDELIEELGGIDLQVLGIGKNGHIGFNEPGSSIHSKTRLVNLDNTTRIANAYEFQNISKVPRLAVTMGISVILKARRILLMGWGMKGKIIARSVEGDVTEQVPASILQQHNDCTFVIDEAASSELTRIKSPWLTGECEWTPKMIKRAVINLALKLNKSILSLTELDYNERSFRPDS